MQQILDRDSVVLADFPAVSFHICNFDICPKNVSSMTAPHLVSAPHIRFKTASAKKTIDLAVVVAQTF